MIRITENEPLKSRHTFGVKTQASHFVETDELTGLFDYIATNSCLKHPFLILGEGSNILFSTPYAGLIIHPAIDHIQILEQNSEEVIVECGAGLNWDTFVAWSIQKGFSGLENLSLIPGSVGAAPVQNIGAYGVEVKDFISAVYVSDLHTTNSFWIPANECHFDYRYSIFKRPEHASWMVWKVRFKLSLTPSFNLSYKALNDYLIDKKDLSISKIRAAVIAIRSSKLPDPEKIGNAGSFFKNPLISLNRLNTLVKEYPDIPYYLVDHTNQVKLAAGWLIEKAGLKGYRKGSAGIYDKQALVLVNYAEASGQELWELAQLIQEKVWKKFGIRLEPEVRII